MPDRLPWLIFGASLTSIFLIISLIIAGAGLLLWIAASLVLLVFAVSLFDARREAALCRMALNAIEAIPIPFAVYDKNTRLIACNPGYRDHHHVALARVDETTQPTYRQLVTAAVPENVEAAERHRIISERLANEVSDDGQMVERYYEGIGWLQIARRRIPSGGSIRLAVDINDVKLKQQQLETALRRAMEAEAAQTQFLATMNHELRTPLNGVIGLTKVLQTEVTNEQQLRYLAIIEQSGLHLLSVVNQILDYCSIQEPDRPRGNHESFDLSLLIEEVQLTLAPLFDEKALELSISVEQGTSMQRCGDVMLLRQILFNLLGNAQKFTQEGSVSLSVSGTDDGGLLFRVKDTGIGIPQTKIDAVFKRFQQVSDGVARQHGGTGLGLAITKEIVEMLNGDISVESEVEKGSTFTLRLPFPVDTATAA